MSGTCVDGVAGIKSSLEGFEQKKPTEGFYLRSA